MTFEPPPSVAEKLAALDADEAAAALDGIPFCRTHRIRHEDGHDGFACPRCDEEQANEPPPQAETLFGVTEDPQTGYVHIRIDTAANVETTSTFYGEETPPPPPLGIADGPFSDEMTLGEARQILEQLAEDGEVCPCCGLRAQVYKRPINGTMARSLIQMYAAWGREWGDLPALRREANLHHSNQEGMLAWFGLIEEEQVRRPDGGRAGFWRVTELGERWAKGETTVQKYARTYGGKVLNLLGSEVTIQEILPEHFDLRSVMAGVVNEGSS